MFSLNCCVIGEGVEVWLWGFLVDYPGGYYLLFILYSLFFIIFFRFPPGGSILRFIHNLTALLLSQREYYNGKIIFFAWKGKGWRVGFSLWGSLSGQPDPHSNSLIV